VTKNLIQDDGENAKGNVVQQNKRGGCGSLDVLSCALLKLNQSPSASFGVVYILGKSGNSNGVCDLLDLVFHTGSEFTSLLVLVNVHLLCTAHDDKDGNVTRLEKACVEDVDVANIQNTAVRYETVLGVLCHESGVDLVLCCTQPLLENFGITLDVGIKNFGKNVLAHLLQPGLHLEARIHLAELLDNLGCLVFCKETSDAVTDTAGGRDQGVL
jgi:hypothetical protein